MRKVIAALLLLAFSGLNANPPLPFGFTRRPVIVFSNLGTVSTTTGASSYATSASYQPAPYALVIAAVINSKASAPDTPTFSGNGLTWTKIDSTNYNTVSSPTCRLTMFRAMGPAPTSGTGTADFAGATQTGCHVLVVQFTGVDSTGGSGGAVVQSVIKNGDASTAPVITLASLAANGRDAVFTAWGGDLNSSTVLSVESGWTEDADVGYNTPATWMGAQHRLDTTDTTPGATTTSIDWAGIAIEIKVQP